MPKGNLSARSQMLMLMMVAVVTVGLFPFLHGPVVSSGRAVQSDNRIQSPIGWLPALRAPPLPYANKPNLRQFAQGWVPHVEGVVKRFHNRSFPRQRRRRRVMVD